MYHIFFASTARQDLRALEPSIAHRILKKLDFYLLQKNPLVFATRLTTPFLDRYRFRIGDYRAVFRVDSNEEIQILMILRIKHRKDIYLS